mgnify:CR=1 FL=1
MGLAWDITRGRSIDLDASAILLGLDLACREIVYFSHLRSRDGTVSHSGDDTSGDEGVHPNDDPSSPTWHAAPHRSGLRLLRAGRQLAGSCRVSAVASSGSAPRTVLTHFPPRTFQNPIGRRRR